MLMLLGFQSWHGNCKEIGNPLRSGSRGGYCGRELPGRAAPPKTGELAAMENTLLVGLSRQVALRRELDVVANNVANLNTNGFKADGVVFHEYLMPVARANNFQG